MSPVTPPSGSADRIRSGKLSGFWQRISEGRRIDELWSQFSADARSSYGFYMTDAVAEDMVNRRGRPRFFRIAKTLFWSLVMKLTPARRVLLILACVLLVVSGFHFEFSNDVKGDFNFTFITVMLLLLLLALELADKVTMKRDLEIAREIQTWLVPSKPPQVAGAEIAFASRPQNSVAGDYYDAFYPTLSASENGKLMLVIADVAGKEHSRRTANGHAAGEFAHDRWRGSSARRTCLAAKSVRFRAQPGWAAIYDGGAWRIRSHDTVSCLCERRPQPSDFAPRRGRDRKIGGWRLAARD